MECIGELTKTNHVGILGTAGTIKSASYPIEIHKIWPDVQVTGQACPMWVPLVEYNEFTTEGADYFIQKDIEELLQQDPQIDTIILGCTHYPLLLEKIRKYTPSHIQLISQGDYVAKSLQNYMERHPEMDARCTKQGLCRFLTTESVEKFEESAAIFLGQEKVAVQHISLE